MLSIEKESLKLYLERNRNIFESKIISGVGEIISGISLTITLVCSEIKQQVLFLSPGAFRIILWIVTSLILLWGMVQSIISIKSHRTVESIYNDIEELGKSDGKSHIFNMVLLKSDKSDGKFLLYKDVRWRCELFPNYKVLDEDYIIDKEKTNVLSKFSSDTGISKTKLKIQYVGEFTNTKYSVGDKVNKTYIFHFYILTAKPLDEQYTHAFSYNGKQYKWKTLNEMYKSKNIKKKNRDVLDYIRSNNL
ncbi:MAG: hypothetical protein J1F63_00660 [Oscillospiraceae bacterium]|nr:hypothetical protein [Oscillospiraceae bacterium]